MLNFIKKYPMSILLAIIAMNLFSIAGSLRQSAKLDKFRELCILQDAAFIKNENEIGGKYFNKLSKVAGVPKGSYFTGTICTVLQEY